MEVVVVGSCNTDLISYVPELPQPGETVQGSKFRSGCGGKGANQCVMAARLGASVAMVAKVGDDQFGREAVQNFRENSVNVDHVTVTKEAHSGVAPITVNDRGENSIVIVGGANMTLGPADVQAAAHLIRGSKVVVCQLEVPQETSLEALRLAKQCGAVTIFNTAPAAPLPDSFFQVTDILVLNETEAEQLSGVAVRDEETARKAAAALLTRGPRCVVITLGAGGVVFSGWGSKDPAAFTHIPAERVATIDTTGAGDAFVGAMAYFLSRESVLPFPEVVRRCGVIASHTTILPGTQTSYQVHLLPPGLL